MSTDVAGTQMGSLRLKRSWLVLRLFLTLFALLFCFCPNQSWAQPQEAFEEEALDDRESNKAPKSKKSANDKDVDPLFEEIERVEKRYPKLEIFRSKLFANTSRKYRHSSGSPLLRDALHLKGSFFTVELKYKHELSQADEKSLTDTLKEEGGSLLRVSSHEGQNGKKFSKILAVVPQELTSFFIAREKVEHGGTDYVLRTAAKSADNDFFGSDQVIWVELNFPGEVAPIVRRALNIRENGYAKIYMTAKEYRAFVPNPKDFILVKLWRMLTLQRYWVKRKIKNRMKGNLVGGSKRGEALPDVKKHWLFTGKLPHFEVVGEYRPLENRRYVESARFIPKKVLNVFRSSRFRGARELRERHSIDRSGKGRHVPWITKGRAPKRRR